MVDQANKLRALVNDKKKASDIKSIDGDNDETTVKVISIVSGKGGVGKTNFTVNLGIALQQMGKKVLIMDADIGMSNANILLGIEANLNLSDLLENKASISDIIVTGPSGVDLITGIADLAYIEGISYSKQLKIIQIVKNLSNYDVVLIDNGAGINKSTITFMNFSDEIVLITTPEPTAITDAYRVLKAISVYKIKDNVKVVVNKIEYRSSGDDTFNKLYRTSEHFLNIEVENLGYIFQDSKVVKSVMEQNPVVVKYPNSISSRSIVQIGENLLDERDYGVRGSSLRQLTLKLFKFLR